MKGSPFAPRHVSTALSGLAFLWASAATIYLLVVAGYGGFNTTTSLSGTEDVVGRLDVSLASANGPWVVGLLLLVTLLAGLPFGVALTDPARQQVVTWSAGSVLLAFSAISGFSVGLMYLPCAVVILAAGATRQVRSRGRVTTEDPTGRHDPGTPPRSVT